MAVYALTGYLQPPLSTRWPGEVTLAWRNGRLLTDDPDLTEAVCGLAEVPVDEPLLPLPAHASPPYLSGHGQSLAWLDAYVMVPGYTAVGDLHDDELDQTPDVLSGPDQHLRKVVA